MKSWWRKAPAAANDERLIAEAGGTDRALRRLEWTVIRRLDGLLQGDYRTLMRGTGLDLADLRVVGSARALARPPVFHVPAAWEGRGWHA